MCGRFVQSLDPETLKAMFLLLNAPAAMARRYNIAPTDEVVIIRSAGPKAGRVPEVARWGWRRPGGGRVINARAESLFEKQMFKRFAKAQRCIVPAVGYYEWRRGESARTPFYVSVRAPGFGMAGLYRFEESPERGSSLTCSVVTTPANDMLLPIHDRMPAILSPEDYDLWLDPGVSHDELLRSLLAPFPSESMAVREVSSKVNSVANDDEGLITEVVPTRENDRAGREDKSERSGEDAEVGPLQLGFRFGRGRP